VLLGIPNAYQRVFALLSQMSSAMPGGLIEVQNLPRQQQIAIMLNTSRETVSRAIAELVQAGVVEKDGRRLIVRRPTELARWASKTETAPGVKGLSGVVGR
jgi:CRP-like cAMP-binding protein